MKLKRLLCFGFSMLLLGSTLTGCNNLPFNLSNSNENTSSNSENVLNIAYNY